MDLEEYAKMYTLEDSHWWFLGKRKVVDKMISKYVSLSSQDQILDVGCGTGGMMSLLRNYGRTFGLDICSSGLQFACQRGFDSLSQGSVLTLPFADDAFALITSFDVLYHEQVGSDLQALREYYRICRPGGILILTDSALPVLSSQHDKAYHAVRRYTANELREKVSLAGFQIEKLSYMNALLFPAVFAVRFWKRHLHGNNGRVSSDLWPVPPLLNSILFSIYSLESSLLSHIDLPIGSSVICVARKSPEAVQGR
jgi:ubiquinone/menaquinone biosynthesis C-methylase UbiE